MPNFTFKIETKQSQIVAEQGKREQTINLDFINFLGKKKHPLVMGLQKSGRNSENRKKQGSNCEWH